MAKEFSAQTEPVVTKAKTPIKELSACPKCGATRFQGEFKRGEIVAGVFIPNETIYQCLNCNHTCPKDELVTHIID